MEYRTDFTNTNDNWMVKTTREISLKIAKGYIIEHRQDEGIWLVWRNFQLQPNSIFSIQATIKRVMSPVNSFFGVTWSLLDVNHFHHFMIAPVGAFAIGTNADKWDLQWKPTSTIKSSIGQSNEIFINVGTAQLQAFVNQQEILRIPRPSEHWGPNIGFIIGPTAKIRITSLSVTIHEVSNGKYENQFVENEEDNDKYEGDDDDAFVNSHGYREDMEGNVFIDGEWMDASEAAEEYRMDRLMDGYVDDD